MTPRLSPIVNHNGTSRSDLVQQRLAASVAIDAAIDAMRGMAPHGRDYPNGPDALNADRDIHWARIGALAALREALIAEGLALMGDD